MAHTDQEGGGVPLWQTGCLWPRQRKGLTQGPSGRRPRPRGLGNSQPCVLQERLGEGCPSTHICPYRAPTLCVRTGLCPRLLSGIQSARTSRYTRLRSGMSYLGEINVNKLVSKGLLSISEERGVVASMDIRRPEPSRTIGGGTIACTHALVMFTIPQTHWYLCMCVHVCGPTDPCPHLIAHLHVSLCVPTSHSRDPN